MDLAETKHFKNRKGNAPLKADGFYDYNVAGFELFDICAELDGYDLAKHGLERVGKGDLPKYFGVICSVQPISDGPHEDFVTIFSSRSPLEELEEDGRLTDRSMNDSGLEVSTYHAANSQTHCMHAVPTPGGVVGISSTGLVFRDYEKNCERAKENFDLLVIDLLLGEQ
ncbi:hypothetical protein [Corynebacterium ulceribovis]|uniref:hypothetical protein n=1 Tax=Corynebacterium ulceribovis TaxID=487732 RepID=UPI0003A4BB7E|nr:hypothetical protein [Corynebacterium ulceribovis]